MSSIQLGARAVGDPTRHELFRYIVAGRPVDVDELTEHLGLHRNAIRRHFAELLPREMRRETRRLRCHVES